MGDVVIQTEVIKNLKKNPNFTQPLYIAKAVSKRFFMSLLKSAFVIDFSHNSRLFSKASPIQNKPIIY